MPNPHFNPLEIPISSKRAAAKSFLDLAVVFNSRYMKLHVDDELDENGFLILNFILLDGRRGGRGPHTTIYIVSNVPYHEGIRLGIVEGNVTCGSICQESEVTSLQGFPETIEGDLTLSYSNLEDFEGMSKNIRGAIWFLGGSVNHFRGYTQPLNKLQASQEIKKTKGYKAYQLYELLGGRPK